MPERLRKDVLAALDEIKDPCSVATGLPLGLVEMGLIKQLEISPKGEVGIWLCLTAPFCHMIGFFHEEAIRRVGAIPGVSTVTLEVDNGLDWSTARMSPEARARRERVFAHVNAAIGKPEIAAIR